MATITTIINSISLNNNEVNEPEKDYKTFSVHESNLSIVNHITKTLLTYKHLENILNILLQQQLTISEKDNLTQQQKELNNDKMQIEKFLGFINPYLNKKTGDFLGYIRDEDSNDPFILLKS